MEIIIHQKKIGTRFHFVGADGLYGNNCQFQKELGKLGLLFVLEAHVDQYIYTEPPVIAIPGKQGTVGRMPTRYKARGTAVEVGVLAKSIEGPKWQKIRLRQTGKGDLNCLGYVQKVYLWDGVSPQYEERMLVIRVTENKDGGREYKYALSNAREGEYTCTTGAHAVAALFYRTVLPGCQAGSGDEPIPGEGMAAWHHHMVLVMMALHFILSEKMQFKNEYPLLSADDVRGIMLNTYPKKGITHEEIMDQIHKRHEQRRIQKELKDFLKLVKVELIVYKIYDSKGYILISSVHHAKKRPNKKYSK